MIYELYYEGDLEISLSNNSTTTSTVSKIIGSGLFNSGFEPDMPCIFTVFANRTVPTLDLNPFGSVLFADLDLQMECQMNLTDPTFYQVSTVQLDMTANFTMNVSDDITIYVDV